MNKPVLDTIRALLDFKETTTYSEVASVAGVPKRKVLDILNANSHLVVKDEKTGKIKSVHPERFMWSKLWQAGTYYREDLDNYGSIKTLKFNGHEELRNELSEQGWFGGFGDSVKATFVRNTPENRAALEKAGIIHKDDVVVDDREWKE